MTMALVASVHAQVDEGLCGSLENAYGPFDYRIATRDQIHMVEAFHFTPRVESLQGGKTSSFIAVDLDYTLRVFPNHHRALMTLARLAQREKREVLQGAQYPTECYFERAIRFQPEDPMPQMIFGLYLAHAKRESEARPYLERAETLSTGDANLHYNLGLAYLDLKDFDRAYINAKRAYDAGFPLPGLRERLKRAGVWKE
ncbi:MAG TPA: ABC transporter permease [Burkholderiaceae bacterium]|nr:ABC transporter permease [Burkholderiaceae bacterium]